MNEPPYTRFASSSSSSSSVSDSLSPSLNVYNALLHIANLRQQESQTLHQQMQLLQQQQPSSLLFPLFPPSSSSLSSSAVTSSSSSSIIRSSSSSSLLPASVQENHTTNVVNNVTAVSSSSSPPSPSPLQILKTLSSSSSTSSSASSLSMVTPPSLSSSIVTNPLRTYPGPEASNPLLSTSSAFIFPVSVSSSSSSSSSTTRAPTPTPTMNPPLSPPPPSFQPHNSSTVPSYHPPSSSPELPTVPLLQGTFRENMFHRHEHTDGISRILNSYASPLASTVITNDHSNNHTVLLSPSSSSFPKRKIEPRQYVRVGTNTTHPSLSVTMDPTIPSSPAPSSIVHSTHSATSSIHTIPLTSPSPVGKPYNLTIPSSSTTPTITNTTGSNTNGLHRPVQQHLVTHAPFLPSSSSSVSSSFGTGKLSSPFGQVSMERTTVSSYPPKTSTTATVPIPPSSSSSFSSSSSSVTRPTGILPSQRTPILPRYSTTTQSTVSSTLRTPGTNIVTSNENETFTLSAAHPILGNGYPKSMQSTQSKDTISKYLPSNSLASTVAAPVPVPVVTLTRNPLPSEKPHRPHRSIILQQKQENSTPGKTTTEGTKDVSQRINESTTETDGMDAQRTLLPSTPDRTNHSSSSPSTLVVVPSPKVPWTPTLPPPDTRDTNEVPRTISTSPSWSSNPLTSSALDVGINTVPSTISTSSNKDNEWSHTVSQIQAILTNKRLQVPTKSTATKPSDNLERSAEFVELSSNSTTSFSSSLPMVFTNSAWIESVKNELSSFKEHHPPSSLSSSSSSVPSSSVYDRNEKQDPESSVDDDVSIVPLSSQSSLKSPTRGDDKETIVINNATCTPQSFPGNTSSWSTTTFVIRSPSKDAAAYGAQQGIEQILSASSVHTSNDTTTKEDTVGTDTKDNDNTVPNVIPTVFTQFSTRVSTRKNRTSTATTSTAPNPLISPSGMLPSTGNPLNTVNGIPVSSILLPPPPPPPPPFSSVSLSEIVLPPPPPLIAASLPLPPPLTTTMDDDDDSKESEKGDDTIMNNEKTMEDTMVKNTDGMMKGDDEEEDDEDDEEKTVPTNSEESTAVVTTNETQSTDAPHVPTSSDNGTTNVSSPSSTPFVSSVALPNELASDIPASPQLTGNGGTLETTTIPSVASTSAVSIMAPSVFSMINDRPPSSF